MCADRYVCWQLRVLTATCADRYVCWQVCVLTAMCADSYVRWQVCVLTAMWADRYVCWQLRVLTGMCADSYVVYNIECSICRSRWPSVLRRGSAVARLLGLWVRIPPGAWMPVYCECCVLSGRGLCGGRSLVQSSPTECVCESFSVIRCDNNPLHLQWVGRREQTKKEIIHCIFVHFLSFNIEYVPLAQTQAVLTVPIIGIYAVVCWQSGLPTVLCNLSVAIHM
jgi:hypothetical protein